MPEDFSTAEAWGDNQAPTLDGVAAALNMCRKLKAASRFIQSVIDTSLVSKSTGDGGHNGNGNAWAEVANTRVPDWSARQLVSECNEAVQAWESQKAVR